MALKKTPLFDCHQASNARIVPFAGYEMPVQYTGVVDEHQTVRNAVGLFDVSHMGEVFFSGPDALKALNQIITNDLTKIADGQACYTMMCKPDGGIIDDLVVYRFSQERLLVCVNASNREKDFSWMKAKAQGHVEVQDLSDDYVQIAVQGPTSALLISRLTDGPIDALKRYWFFEGQIAHRPAIIARTGYTGEDGFELYVANDAGPAVWNALLKQGQDLGTKPAGLGARDSLRLEMKYPLYGNDIDEDTHPYEAGLGWTVKLGKNDFIGKAALEKAKAEGAKRKLVGFEVTGRGIARGGYAITQGETSVGKVTSGTMSPSLKKAIGLGYVPKDLAPVGSRFDIRIRDRAVAAQVVPTPFYGGAS